MTVDVLHRKAFCVFMSEVIKHYECRVESVFSFNRYLEICFVYIPVGITVLSAAFTFLARDQPPVDIRNCARDIILYDPVVKTCLFLEVNAFIYQNSWWINMEARLAIDGRCFLPMSDLLQLPRLYCVSCLTCLSSSSSCFIACSYHTFALPLIKTSLCDITIVQNSSGNL